MGYRGGSNPVIAEILGFTGYLRLYHYWSAASTSYRNDGSIGIMTNSTNNVFAEVAQAYSGSVKSHDFEETSYSNDRVKVKLKLGLFWCYAAKNTESICSKKH